MQRNSYTTVLRIAQKEMTLFFASPSAYLFLAAFVAVTLFSVFWGEGFFARNISDIRPLLEWLPLLLLFLTSTLTMKLWSEETRNGTIEHVITTPVALWQYVLGKFIGCLLLLSIALLITLPLPMTISFMGNLDWGPVLAGYFASFLLGAFYLSIGLFVSSRSDNQIVSLLTSVFICGLFYLVGSKMITSLFANQTSDLLRLLGSGSRFDAITRGVIDFRDFFFYLSFTAIFLVLNVYSIEKQSWNPINKTTRQKNWSSLTALIIANLLLSNVWLSQVKSLRIDTTEGQIYSISNATRNYLARLQEPLLIRAYFSQKTHPLLAPLVPQLTDLLEEYQVAGGDKVRVEIIDPTSDPEIEKEAMQKYSIKPVPFQISDRYQSSIVNSYFNVVLQYGDEYKVLGFRDLIETKATETDMDVQLHNPELDITSAIKKILVAYQASGNLFETVKSELQLNAYISEDSFLPQQLIDYKQIINEVLNEYKAQAKGRFKVSFIEPELNNGEVATKIGEQYGFQAMKTNLFSQQQFYFYLTIGNGDQLIQIPLDELTKVSFEKNLKAGIKRFASGFTKTVAVVSPVYDPQLAQYGISGAQFNQIKTSIGDKFNLQTEDLKDGSVSGEADVLLLLAPKMLDEKQLFAVDQFLMQGGTVVLSSSPYSANLSHGQLSMSQQKSGLEDWLKNYGIEIKEKLVMDPQNTAFPIPLTRNIGGFQVQDLRMIDYPYFVDIRSAGLNQNNSITNSLPQLTFAWGSPLAIDKDKQSLRTVTNLIQSSDQSWLSNSTKIMPDLDPQGAVSYQPQGETDKQLLAVMVKGHFDSYFSDKRSPLLNNDSDLSKKSELNSNQEPPQADELDKPLTIASVVKQSPDSARIIVFSSNDFLSDQVTQLAGASSRSQYLNTSQLLTNTLDWILGDHELMSIRSRGHFNRLLEPMDHSEQLFWEYLNYFLAGFALLMIALVRKIKSRTKQEQFKQLLVKEG